MSIICRTDWFSPRDLLVIILSLSLVRINEAAKGAVADKLPLHFMNHHDVTPSGEQNRVRDRGHNCRQVWLVAFP
jgi:hypothetical protein